MRFIQGKTKKYNIDLSECFWDMLVMKENNIAKVPDDCIKNTNGVYIFYDWNGTPLRIGKAVKLRNRILSYNIDFNSCKVLENIQDDLAYVSVIYTNSGKESSFLELDLLETIKPKYNTVRN